MTTTTSENSDTSDDAASEPVNGGADISSTTSRTNASVKSSQSDIAAGTSSRHEHVEMSGVTRSNADAKTSPDDDSDSEPEGKRATQTKSVRAFLERLPEIQRQLLEAETAPNRAFAEFMARLMPTEMQLRAPLRRLQDDYKTMDEMGVHRASKRPERRWIHILFMLGLVLLEAFINGSLLASGMEGGRLEGWTVAAGVSLLNVILLGAILGASSLRWLNHRRLGLKFLGALSFCAVLAVAYSSNLWVAHYRDALLGPDPDSASSAARAVWLAHPVNPLSVNNVESLWLLVLGLVFTTIGFIDGFQLDDPYPGYGRFYLRHCERQENYQSLFERSFNELRDVQQLQDSRLTALADEINKRFNEFLLLRGRYARKPDDPDFDAWKQVEEGFPEARVKAVLNELTDKRNKIFEEYASAMRRLRALDPTISGE